MPAPDEITAPQPARRPGGPVTPTLGEATREWARIGVLSFGGPAAQIALMHRIVVEERAWLTERRFLDALSFCMLLPGPEAMQLATYAGWRLHGVVGGLVAGLLFVLPGAVVMLGLSCLYALYGTVPSVEALFLGIKAAVLVIVVEALLRVAKRALLRPLHWGLAGAAFVAIFFLALPYPLVIAAAALIGAVAGAAGQGDAAPPLAVTPGRTLRTVTVWLGVWLVPLLALDMIAPGSILGEIGRFFSVLATVTFGGAYAVLAFMAQDAVAGFGWLGAGEMMDGLGLAETTPGPLILVTQFVGFLAAARDEGGVSLAMGLAGAGVTLWATFAPCFLWIFAGAPYIDWIGTRPRLRGALAGITAAVVGVILNLSLWFALHVFFGTVTRESAGPLTLWVPQLATLDWRVPVIAGVAGVLLLRLHRGLVPTLAVCAALGLLLGAL